MSSADRLTAAVVERCRVTRELGAGGMATVYLAHDLKHERDVAIKVLHPDLGAALGAERFLSEIKTTAKLQHPHILALLQRASGSMIQAFDEIGVGEVLRPTGRALVSKQRFPIDEPDRYTVDCAFHLRGPRVIEGHGEQSRQQIHTIRCPSQLYHPIVGGEVRRRQLQ